MFRIQPPVVSVRSRPGRRTRRYYSFLTLAAGYDPALCVLTLRTSAVAFHRVLTCLASQRAFGKSEARAIPALLTHLFGETGQIFETQYRAPQFAPGKLVGAGGSRC
jgi:hypothetical protein